MEELAEVLAVDFGDAEGVPKLNPNWRWEDEEQALLTSCSSLIAIIETEDSRVVQFSHFSVKEFLTSTRLADSIKDISRYHIDLEPAHTILAQACIGVLLQSDDFVDENGTRKSSPLAKYAAQLWATHAQFKSVSSFLRKAMEYLFDLDKPYFAAWLELHDIDIKSRYAVYYFGTPPTSSPTPLYYASLCGFQDLVEHLVVKHPGHVNTSGGFYVTPLVAALARRHFQIANILHHNGADLNVRGKEGDTLLHSPAWYGDVEMVQVLLNYKVDVNTRRDGGWASLYDASYGACSTTIHNVVQSLPDTIQLLLEHGGDVNIRAHNDWTPLHGATVNGRVKVICMLLEHGANVDARDDGGRTPLHEAAENGRVEVVQVLLKHGANVGAKDNEGWTPLHQAVDYGREEVVRVLLEHGANVGAKDNEGRTPLHQAAENGMYGPGVVRVLLEHGANVGAKDYEGRTPFQLASVKGYKATVKLLSEYGAKGAQYMIPCSTSSLCLLW